MKQLLESLRQAGQSPMVLDGRVMVLPFGGRVIGLFPDGVHNVLWVNGALRSAYSARDLFADEGWADVGGDRTWISPEIDTNVGDAERWEETYDVPKAIDPAHFRVSAADDHSALMSTNMNVLFRRTGDIAALELTKQATSVLPPVDLPSGVLAAGYSLKSSIRTAGQLPDSVNPGIWNILQVPGGGRIIIPLAEDAAVRTLTGIPAYERRGGTIVCSVNTEASFKFGIHALDSRGIAFYMREQGDHTSLVVRGFDVVTDALYADVPFDSPTETGYMQQVYVDDGALGGFGEIEYHAPAIHGHATVVTDVSEVWAFAGPNGAVAEVLQELISHS